MGESNVGLRDCGGLMMVGLVPDLFQLMGKKMGRGRRAANNSKVINKISKLVGGWLSKCLPKS